MKKLEEQNWKFESLPVYSARASIRDYDLFGPLRASPSNTKFEFSGEVKNELNDFISMQSP
jgi:hypothetical protein